MPLRNKPKGERGTLEVHAELTKEEWDGIAAGNSELKKEDLRTTLLLQRERLEVIDWNELRDNILGWCPTFDEQDDQPDNCTPTDPLCCPLRHEIMLPTCYSPYDPQAR